MKKATQCDLKKYCRNQRLMLSMSLSIPVSLTVSIFKCSIMVPIIMTIFWMAFYYIIFGFIGVSNDHLGIFSSLVTGISFAEYICVKVRLWLIDHHLVTAVYIIITITNRQ